MDKNFLFLFNSSDKDTYKGIFNLSDIYKYKYNYVYMDNNFFCFYNSSDKNYFVFIIDKYKIIINKKMILCKYLIKWQFKYGDLVLII